MSAVNSNTVVFPMGTTIWVDGILGAGLRERRARQCRTKGGGLLVDQLFGARSEYILGQTGTTLRSVFRCFGVFN